MAELKKLFENYLKSSYRTTPIRSPFSQTNYYTGGRVSGGEASWQDLTELYNTTYRTHYEEEGFNRVMYNEPLNMMLMWPKEDAKAFEMLEENECVAKFGLKTARGFKKDYRFLDMSIPGAGKVALTEEEAEELLEDPFQLLREVRPQYTRNLGETPVERIDESVDREGKAVQRKINGLIREELDGILSEQRDVSIDLSEDDNKTARIALRQRQLNEDLTRMEDAVIDICAKSLREGKDLSPEETNQLKEAIENHG